VRGTASILAVLALALVGCGGPERRFVGTWDGSVDMSPEAIEEVVNKLDPDNPHAATGMRAGLAAVTLTLELKKDRTYSLTTAFPGQAPDVVTGKWRTDADGKTVTLDGAAMTPERVAEMRATGASDKDIAKLEGTVVTLSVSKDKKTLAGPASPFGIQLDYTFAKR
jgi:hypothetical protein